MSSSSAAANAARAALRRFGFSERGRGLTARDVRRAYLQRAKVLHPDVNAGEDAKAKFIQLQNDYAVINGFLRDANLRAEVAAASGAGGSGAGFPSGSVAGGSTGGGAGFASGGYGSNNSTVRDAFRDFRRHFNEEEAARARASHFRPVDLRDAMAFGGRSRRRPRGGFHRPLLQLALLFIPALLLLRTAEERAAFRQHRGPSGRRIALEREIKEHLFDELRNSQGRSLPLARPVFRAIRMLDEQVLANLAANPAAVPAAAAIGGGWEAHRPPIVDAAGGGGESGNAASGGGVAAAAGGVAAAAGGAAAVWQTPESFWRGSSEDAPAGGCTAAGSGQVTAPRHAPDPTAAEEAATRADKELRGDALPTAAAAAQIADIDDAQQERLRAAAARSSDRKRRGVRYSGDSLARRFSPAVQTDPYYLTVDDDFNRLHRTVMTNDLRGVWDSVVHRRSFVDQPDRRLRTALHYAAHGGALDCVRLLLLLNANPLAADAAGETPLDAARASGKKAAEQLLLFAVTGSYEYAKYLVHENPTKVPYRQFFAQTTAACLVTGYQPAPIASVVHAVAATAHQHTVYQRMT